MIVDLFCGRGGWTKGFLAAGFEVVGYDIFRHKGYPGHLIIQDVTTVSGCRWRGKVDLIVASPVCTEFARWGMRCWFKQPPEPDMSLTEAAIRIAKEARATLLLENVLGARYWLGPEDWRAGSFLFWGWRPVLLPNQFNFPMTKRCNRVRSPAKRSEIPFALSYAVARAWQRNPQVRCE